MDEKMLTPRCVGFIMDGNRRWAKESGRESMSGHLAGKDKFIEVIKWVEEMQILHAVFYAFSTENWKRDEKEVAFLLSFLEGSLDEVSTRIKIIGRREDFSKKAQENINGLERRGSESKSMTTIWVALSYGGRAEVIEAVNQAIKLGQKVTEETFSKLLWTGEMPDPDLIIRTGGEHRLSNFLPWQSIYSELFFTDTYWPAFTKEEFQRILSEYAKRDRRHGC